MSTVKVNMDICYSDTLADFQGCYFNYDEPLPVPRTLKRGIPQDIHAPRSGGNQRWPEHALLAYRNFCKSAYFTEKIFGTFSRSVSTTCIGA